MMLRACRAPLHCPGHRGYQDSAEHPQHQDVHPGVFKTKERENQPARLCFTALTVIRCTPPLWVHWQTSCSTAGYSRLLGSRHEQQRLRARLALALSPCPWPLTLTILLACHPCPCLVQRPNVGATQPMLLVELQDKGYSRLQEQEAKVRGQQGTDCSGKLALRPAGPAVRIAGRRKAHVQRCSDRASAWRAPYATASL